jgi:DNA-binding response OmpR family regulator/HPt (histidine-containing phosphotransfer) domain-containing protein
VAKSKDKVLSQVERQARAAKAGMKLLLVEDDEILANILLDALTAQRYIVEVAQNGESGWDYIQSGNYDLIILDVGLPKLDGIALCQRLRSRGYTVPVLLMTAKEEKRDRVRGLDSGADDYLVKPLDLEELQARVRALLRRGEVLPTSVIEVGQLRLNPVSCEVFYQEQLLPLTPKEYSLLELLMRNPSRVFSRAQIIEHLWTFDDPPQEESVKAHIKGLRQKLKKAGAVNWIENVYGLGYRFNPQEPSEVDIAPASEQKVKTVKKPATTAVATPAKTVEAQFDQAKEGLWNQYQGLMTERLQVLEVAKSAIQSSLFSQELHQQATQAAHKLAGVLGMFDRPEGSVLAKEIEKILQGDHPLKPSQGQNLLSLIEQLRLQIFPEGKSATTPEVSIVKSEEEALNVETQNFASLQGFVETPLIVHPSHQQRLEVSVTTHPLLLIDSDWELGKALQELAQPVNQSWEQVTTLAEAKIWLATKQPDLVVMRVEDNEQKQDYRSLVTELAQLYPAIPVIVLTTTDNLLDRVTLAQAGVQRFLVQPVTATQIWEMGTQLLQRHHTQTTNILVVDDDPIILDSLQRMLKPSGMEVRGLCDPLQFWDVLRSVSPDLLILDVEMPQLSGIELCQAVRTDPHWQSLPILFLTAHNDAATLQQSFQVGADDYIVKPIVESELLTRIHNRIERTRLLRLATESRH